MNEIEITVKSLLPPDEAQGVYRLRVGQQDTVEKLLRILCRESHSVFRDEYCLRSKEHQLLQRSDTLADIGLKDGAFLHWTSETTFKKPSSCCNVFWFLAAISFIIGLVGIVALCVIKFQKEKSITDYAVVFDAGSSHTAMFVYKWDGSKFNGTAVAVQSGDKCSNKKGISSYVDNPEGAGPSLEDCLKQAKNFIPKGKHSSTPVYLGATAGMRLLNISNPKESDEIMKSVRSTLSKSSFSFSQPEKSARIISGFEEGSFSWITSNYITNAFDVLQYRRDHKEEPASVIISTMGAMDLGGASTQISFIPENVTDLPSGYVNELELFGHTYKLYTHSYLCYGINEVRTRILAHLVNKQGAGDSVIKHACLPEGFNTTISHGDIFSSPCVHGDTANKAFGSSILPPSTRADQNYTFVGSKNPKGCQDLVQTVMINASVPCPYSQCSFNGIYQPPVNGLFYAFSSFYYTTSFMNLTSVNRTFFNHSTFLYEIDRICTMPWNILKTLPGSFAFLPWYCHNAVFINILLFQGYRFTETEWLTINFAEKVSSTEIGWTLGFVLNESNNYPSDRPEVTLYTLTFILLMILFSLFVLVALGLLWHARRMRPSSGFNHRRLSTYGAI